MDSLLTISEISRRSGVASSALRFYEERGLIHSQRAGSGHRRYQRDVVRRIAFIVFAQRIGLTLEEVGEELGRLPTRRVPDGLDWAEISTRWSLRVDERIAELQRLRGGLTGCIGYGCLSLAICKLVNPNDRARLKGAGPYAWIGEPRRPVAAAAMGTENLVQIQAQGKQPQTHAARRTRERITRDPLPRLRKG